MKAAGPGKKLLVEYTLAIGRRKALERRGEVPKLIAGVGTVGPRHTAFNFVQIQVLCKNENKAITTKRVGGN